MGKNSRKNSSKKTQSGSVANESVISPSFVGSSAERDSVIPPVAPLLTAVKTGDMIQENGNGKVEQIQEKGMTEVVNDNGVALKIQASADSGAEVETSTDDIGNQNPSKEKKKNNRRKKGPRSTDSGNGEEGTILAGAETEEPITKTEVPSGDILPESFADEEPTEKQEQLDHLMTEMKKSLSPSSSISVPDVATFNRVISPTTQPDLVPLDPFTEAIAKRETLLTHGLVIPCGWSWCETDQMKAIYSALVNQFASLEAETPPEERLLYLYAPTELHCTVATLSSFKESATYFASLYQSESANGELERQEVMSLWNLALREYFTMNDCALFSPDGSFHATVERIEVCDSAIIFHIETGGAMDIMRSAVKFAREHRVFREYEITKGLSPYELTRLVHIPNITHSTFIRFRQPPSEALRKALESIATSWVPLDVQMKGMQIVYENRPYMHLDPHCLTAFPVFPLPVSAIENPVINTDSTDYQTDTAAASVEVTAAETERESVTHSVTDALELVQKSRYEEIDPPCDAEELEVQSTSEPELIVKQKISKAFEEIDAPEETEPEVSPQEGDSTEFPALLAEPEIELVAEPAAEKEESAPAAPASPALEPEPHFALVEEEVKAVEEVLVPEPPILKPEPHFALVEEEVKAVEEVLVPEPPILKPESPAAVLVALAEEVKPSEPEPVPAPVVAAIVAKKETAPAAAEKPLTSPVVPVAIPETRPVPLSAPVSVAKPTPSKSVPVPEKTANVKPAEKTKTANPKSAEPIKATTPSTASVDSFSPYALLALGTAVVLGAAFLFYKKR